MAGLMEHLENPLRIQGRDQRNNEHFAKEQEYMISLAGCNLFVRQDAVSGIIEIFQRKIPSILDPIVRYFAIDYLDRFLSKKQIMPDEELVMKCLPMACFFVASKMMGIENQIEYLHEELASQFSEGSMKAAEEMVVGVLDSHTRPITPFCFFAYFFAIFPPLVENLQVLHAHTCETLFKSQTAIRLREFRPSVIAASAFVSAAVDLLGKDFTSLCGEIWRCGRIDEVGAFPK